MTSQFELLSIIPKVAPSLEDGVHERDNRDVFAAEQINLLRRERVYSALVPQDIGGGGARYSDMCAFLRQLAHHCPSTALAVSMHQHLVSAALFNHRNGRPGVKVLERVAADEAVLVSTGANDWMDSNGTARRVEGGYRITARKPFASGAPLGNILMTSAVSDESSGSQEVLHFPVPMASEGVSLLDDWKAMGMRSTGSHTVVLSDVFVPEEAIALRRPRGQFHPVWNTVIAVAMPLIMSVYVGVAESAARKAQDLTLSRKGDPTIPFLLGEMNNALTAAQLAVDDMIRLAADLDFTPGLELSSRMLTRKTLAARQVVATAEKALELAGGAGFYSAAGLERLLRDAHAAQFHPLPEKRQQAFTGRVLMGLDPISGA